MFIEAIPPKMVETAPCNSEKFAEVSSIKTFL